MLSSMNSSSRRSGTNLNGSATSSPASVRAPQRTIAPDNARSPLTPMALSAESCASESAALNPCTPSTFASTPAGAFQTPREASMRA
jgi:hypothetical protein